MKYFSGEELCIPQDCPTPRAADGGNLPRFSGSFPAFGFSCFDGESTLPPTAATRAIGCGEI
jgi:hypothetical protein